jgi:hypothetical protein
MTARPIARYAAIAAGFAAVGTLGFTVAGPALGPAPWWAMNHQPTLPSPSVLGVALLVLGVIWVTTQDSGEGMGPVRPVSPAGLLARLARYFRDARGRYEREAAASSGFMVSRDDLDYAESLMFAGRGLRF